MTIRATIGWLGWQVSRSLANLVLGTPSGWTLCGFVGLCAAVTPVLRPVETFLDWVFNDPRHCYKAMWISIERAGYE